MMILMILLKDDMMILFDIGIMIMLNDNLA